MYDKVPNPIGKMETIIYKKGRHSCFFYIEGNAYPIDYRKVESKANPQYIYERKKMDITSLWSAEKSGFQGMVDDIMPYLVVGIVILLIIILVKK